MLLGFDEGYVFAPAASGVGIVLFLVLVLAFKLVDVFLAEDDFFLGHGKHEVFSVSDVVELGQTVEEHGRGFEPVAVKEVGEQLFALFLGIAGVSAQDGLDLCLCLGCGGEVDPCRIDVYGFGGEDFYLVTALQPVAHGHELVVDLGSYAVGTKEGVDGESEVECRGS